MKKYLLIIIAMVLLAIVVPASAENGTDNFSDELLKELKYDMLVMAEFSNGDGFELPSAMYAIGERITGNTHALPGLDYFEGDWNKPIVTPLGDIVWFKIPGDEMDWYLVNVFGIQPNHNLPIYEYDLYYYDGYYYGSCGGRGGLDGSPFEINKIQRESNDLIYLEFSFYDDTTDEEWYKVYSLLREKYYNGHRYFGYEIVRDYPISQTEIDARKADNNPNVDPDSFFQCPDYINPYSVFSIDLAVGEYVYGSGSSWNLSRYKEKDGSDYKILAYDTINFITDGTTIYYTPTEDDAIYRMNADGSHITEVLRVDNCAVLACWNNTLLYYSTSDDVSSATWIYDMQTGVKQYLFSEVPAKMYAYKGKLYYLETQVSVGYSGLYVSDLNGANPILLHDRVCDFKIIDGEIYYAKCLDYYDIENMNFQVMKSAIDGSSQQAMTNVILASGCQNVFKDRVTIRRKDHLESVYYVFNGIGMGEFYPFTGKIIANGRTLSFDQSPMIQNGRTLVPIRTVFEAMGYNVFWDGEEQRIDIADANKALSCWIGRDAFEVTNKKNNSKYYYMYLEVVPQIVNGRTLVPLRSICDALGWTVQWDELTNTVIIKA